MLSGHLGRVFKAKKPFKSFVKKIARKLRIRKGRGAREPAVCVATENSLVEAERVEEFGGEAAEGSREWVHGREAEWFDNSNASWGTSMAVLQAEGLASPVDA